MRLVTFNEIVTGMVLHPVWDVNGSPEDFSIDFNELIVVDHTELPCSSGVWKDKRSIHFIAVRDPYYGVCSSTWNTGDGYKWIVVDDQDTLDRVRAHVKTCINNTRDVLDHAERLVDKNV